MNKLEFIQPIKMRRKLLYDEMKERNQLTNDRNSYKQQIVRINRLLVKARTTLRDNTDIELRTYLDIIRELETMKIGINEKISELTIYIDNCTQWIKYFQEISKITIPLG